MITDALILAGSQTRKIWSLGGAVGFAVFVACVALVIICIYRAAEYFGSAKKEQKLLRIEMGKLRRRSLSNPTGVKGNKRQGFVSTVRVTVFVQAGITKFGQIRERKKKMIGTISEDLEFWLLPVMLAAYAFIFALIIICLIRVSTYFRTAGKEQKLIRMELGKVAEEVHLLRQELKGGKNSDS